MSDEQLKQLSASARELYAKMQAGDAQVYYMRYMGSFNPSAYYYRSDTGRRCTRQVASLLAAGLIERFDENWSGHSIRVKA